MQKPYANRPPLETATRGPPQFRMRQVRELERIGRGPVASSSVLNVRPNHEASQRSLGDHKMKDVALIVGGAETVLEEYQRALDMCAAAGLTTENFCANDMIEQFEGVIDNAVTLHPEKLGTWLMRRRAAGRPEPGRVWCHRPYNGVTNWTRDKGGSSGLFGVKIARELHYTHVVLCGVHMTLEGQHFLRKTDWTAYAGFRRSWVREMTQIKPYVRSFAGWTRTELGAVTSDWLQEKIEDRHWQPPKPIDLKA